MVLFIGPLYGGKHDAAKAYVEATGKDWSDMRVCDEVDKALSGDYDIVIVNEVGSGLVPMEAEAREAREALGRLSVQLAKQADEVYRVVAGLTKQLK